ncbi:hypothetical protein A2962_05095 [Candidatus Woesebacteria bacterium RIFCSPLOWO2_01_FULL_39_61]|uniref:Glycosyltransferase 2-like domain-containing protein n=1 Tax=Candidatus Woesebacteria bacterium RIFCSPHIGHO2_02_FULL_39_13 TaxID=1802505 RepID=A0A1F7YZM9_9BACT|nr:MAG: hypothetical protein A2692_03345 [Candidatus Woesebacteria bacterium RIFCSPHIGHO2_01_FULL_39_95]OGM32644.1 MAG: hypothetical protein A3D01_05320 [Candidatus Woesebacteria bacterium RIFCSPHIGHO2_02_FULL_39_13]OGM66712.1 MAG: hypothetical protein A2962_05095 [Candidatus Woesebacteria bacterium RIFCSPLOWO2_01_FULL_39_61]OGM73783.1 MAG: hypothetical protein A3H19_02615 [Candidatus Woesebacteria bacterium RIFCSPLOWO2_12_FULL_39_9]
MKKVKLSIVVLSYNTKDLLKNCLKSLEKVRNEVEFEVIVPDNGSTDGSPEMVEKEFPWVKKVIKIGKNLGFAAGNNKARYFINGVYVLFLNPDAQVHTNTLFKTIKYLDSHADVGALGCKIVLPNGQLDKDARRSFITPWIGLTHIYLKLDRIFPKSKLFAKYWYGYISPNEEHEVDSLQGAFLLTRKRVLDQVGWFDEDYFLNAEDIDLCWKIKEKGWKIIYYPEVSITHIKGAAKGKTKETKKKVNLKEKLKYRLAEVDAMELFVKKRLWKKYPLALNLFVLTGTKLLRLIRAIRVILLG